MSDLIIPDEIPEIPMITIENIILSDGTEIAVKDFPEGSTAIDYRRVNGGYGGDCALILTVSSQESAHQEIKDALEIELVEKSKIDSIPESIIKKQLIDAIQYFLDKEAQAHFYDGILSLCSYATSTNPKFGPEGQAGVIWRDACWSTGYAIMAEVEAQTREIPTVDELLAEMPAMEWPT